MIANFFTTGFFFAPFFFVPGVLGAGCGCCGFSGFARGAFSCCPRGGFAGLFAFYRLLVLAIVKGCEVEAFDVLAGGVAAVDGVTEGVAVGVG
jgi:hypothetical protein